MPKDLPMWGSQPQWNKHKGKKKRRKPAKTQLDLLDRKPRQGRKP